MTMTVFTKTPKGRQEVETKAHGLSTLERWVLIYIDGKRTVNDLKTLPRINDLNSIITVLEAGGYITLLNPLPSLTAEAPASTAPSPVVSQPSSTTSSIFRQLPARFDPAKFNMAKNFMINTLNAFKGQYGATSLVRNIDHCQTHEALRSQFEPWYEAIANTAQGKKQGSDLRAKLLEVL